jgi:general secretion pathway protein C
LRNGLLTKRNIFYLNILIGILLIGSVLLLFREILTTYVSAKRVAKPFSTAAGTPPAPPVRDISDYHPIFKNNPFGFPAGELKLLIPSAGQGVRKTDVALIGTVAGPRELSYAIFKDNTGRQEVFKVGEPVFGLGSLSSVKMDRVIIGKGPDTTELLLEDVKVKEINKQASPGAAPASLFAQRIGRGAYVVDQARLQQAIANPAQMMTDARLRPNTINGRDEGFVLSEVKPGGIYQSLGLQDGDVLLRINEYDISNPERALQAFTALKGLDRVQVDLIRQGTKMTMTYQIQ